MMQEHRILRAIYAIEFLAALIAAFLVWNYVGGPTHLDYVPWPWKALLPVAIAATTVRITMGGGRRWLFLLAVLIVSCGLLSYYAHLTEPLDEGDEGDQVVPTRYVRGN